MSSLNVGIDPGLRGGIAALDPTGQVMGTWPMPVAGGEVYAAGLADLLRSLRCFDGYRDISRVCLEKVGAMPKQGVVSTFRFGTGWGTVRGVCAALAIPVTLVPPTVWKKFVLVGLAHDKAGAIQFCANRWPTADLILPGCRVAHDGIAEALCLAHYGLMHG
ncbi:MAG: Holliday junction endonuclease [Planctomycetes bacterium]|nr:Holliday junction endonuclease [Planctomycetota bacterium]